MTSGARCLALATILAALALGCVASSRSSSSRPKCEPKIFGYRIGPRSGQNTHEAVVRRFGKTYEDPSLAHSDSPVYQSSDRKAYLVFGWADSGLEILMVSVSCPSPKHAAKITRIEVASGKLTASCGVALGDTSARVRRLAGRPDMVKKKSCVYGSPIPGESNWIYVSEWLKPPGQPGKRLPVKVTEFVFKQDRVVRMIAAELEP